MERMISLLLSWTKEGKRDIYKMAKIQERKTRDITKSNALRTEKFNFW